MRSVTEEEARALERGVIARRASIDEFYSFLDDHGRQGRDGTATLRLVLDEWLLGDRPPDSVLEAMLARLVTRHDLPPFEFQYEVQGASAGAVARVDMAWPRWKLAVEVDGLHAHSTAAQLQSDWHRQNALVELGWSLLRFTWADIVRQPRAVVDQIARRVARAA